jgi:hypothetical protein
LGTGIDQFIVMSISVPEGTPLIYAGAQIENTTISVGAIGPAADEIENLLGQKNLPVADRVILDQDQPGILRLGGN